MISHGINVNGIGKYSVVYLNGLRLRIKQTLN